MILLITNANYIISKCICEPIFYLNYSNSRQDTCKSLQVSNFFYLSSTTISQSCLNIHTQLIISQLMLPMRSNGKSRVINRTQPFPIQNSFKPSQRASQMTWWWCAYLWPAPHRAHRPLNHSPSDGSHYLSYELSLWNLIPISLSCAIFQP